MQLKVSKIKEVVVDFRSRQEDHLPVAINNTEVQQVDSYKFLGVTSSTLTWKDHTNTIVMKALQRAFFEKKQLKKCGVSSKGLLRFYWAAVERIFSSATTVCRGGEAAEQGGAHRVRNHWVWGPIAYRNL